MNTLVTGATGYTGSCLVRRLIKDGIRVRILARFRERARILEEIGAELVVGDIRDRAIMDKAVEGVDVVFHLAAAFRTVGLKDKDYWDIHVLGTKNILEASIRSNIKRFVHCSTIGVHGGVLEIPANEESPFNPGDIYQVTKLEGEKLAIQYWRDKGLPVVVVRPAGIYGPGEMRFFKLFKAVNKGKFIMIGNGRVFWHPVYIDDLLEGIILSAEVSKIEGEAFIIGDEEYITLNELVDSIASVLEVKLKKIYIPAWPIQLSGSFCELVCKPFGIKPPIYRRRVDFFTKDRAFDISKAKARLGYKPRYDLLTGLRLTAQWYKENGLLK